MQYMKPEQEILLGGYHFSSIHFFTDISKMGKEISDLY